LDEPLGFSQTARFHIQKTLPLGPAFPLRPCLDREGRIFASLHDLLLNRLQVLRSRLVEASANFQQDDWFHDLRGYIADCVSLVDVTLHQLYFKAQYDPLPGWKFDAAVLGDRYGRRLFDKLRWVGQITGRPLDDAGRERATLATTKALRNHMSHFDPPCLCFTLEDAAQWLNNVHDIATLIWKIRTRAGSPLNSRLTALLLAPKVAFVPLDPSLQRAPQSEGVGYASSAFVANGQPPSSVCFLRQPGTR
jgi:hypothetical protein